MFMTEDNLVKNEKKKVDDGDDDDRDRRKNQTYAALTGVDHLGRLGLVPKSKGDGPTTERVQVGIGAVLHVEMGQRHDPLGRAIVGPATGSRVGFRRDIMGHVTDMLLSTR